MTARMSRHGGRTLPLGQLLRKWRRA
ncbi:hypothetical protein NC651_015431 [Populus alba x Populus x berolinensis]|nr:hypothetical protein NC651_015431 [Populus alba x Populus x berolinensis]